MCFCCARTSSVTADSLCSAKYSPPSVFAVLCVCCAAFASDTDTFIRPLLFLCVKGAGYKTSILAVLYYGETYCVYAAAACQKYDSV